MLVCGAEEGVGCSVFELDDGVAVVVGVLVVSWLELLGPGCEASPTRVARSPYRELRRLCVGGGVVRVSVGVSGGWRGLWSPRSVVNVVVGWYCWW